MMQQSAQVVAQPVRELDLHYTLDHNFGKFANIMETKNIDPNILVNRIKQTFGKPGFKTAMYEVSGLVNASFRFLYIDSIKKFSLISDTGDCQNDIKVMINDDDPNSGLIAKRPKRHNNNGARPTAIRNNHYQQSQQVSATPQQAAQPQRTINPEFINAN